jgi:anti-sigma factor RsiW
VTCEEFVELVTAYLDGALPEPDRLAFEAHLRDCPGCDRYLDQFRDTIDLLGELPPQSMSPESRTRLLAAFADWHQSRRPAP